MKTALLLVAMSTMALGQSLTEPPVLFRIIRNVGGQRLYGQGRPTVPVFAASSVTGLMESWVLEAHDSFGSIEDMDRMLGGGVNGPIVEPPRVMVAAFRPGLSYRANDAAKAFAKSPYFQISLFQLRPGG